MVAFGDGFLGYLLIFLILVAIAAAGVMVGKTLRIRKDAKELDAAENKTIEDK